MSLSWFQRKTRLSSLLRTQGDEDAEGLALDRILHGQNVIGKTSKTTEIDAIRFQDKDLTTIGTLEYGQFGVIYVVTCRLDGSIYVRKSIEKRLALRTRDQCSPQFERDILLQAAKTSSPWAPHLLCAFQTPCHLNLVMRYAEGGNLWDVLESSPHNGKVLESDLRWWTPQIISAIHWCHAQGFVHRDVKPNNFVLTPDAHVLLVDFGSAAPLLPPNSEGVQFLPKRYCLVPCGTCDYISPEILKAHEEALVALEMEDEDGFQPFPTEAGGHGYGRETDWWSLGAMLYEMAYGFTPFFAKDIRQTYLRIMDHEESLRFDHNVSISQEYQEFLSLLLIKPEQRLGRRHIQEITNHPIFDGIDWDTLPAQIAPSGLHLPQFTYSEPAKDGPAQSYSDNAHSQGFNFSALFQSTVESSSPGLSVLLSRSSYPQRPPEEDATASFIGFSWGPALDAFPPQNAPYKNRSTPDTIQPLSTKQTPSAILLTPRWGSSLPLLSSTDPNPNRFSTPIRSSSLTPFPTLRRTSTIRHTGLRRNVSDREAMKQLVDCIGMSARKKVLESGRKPRILVSFNHSGTLKKDLGFLDYVGSTINSNSSDSRGTDITHPPSSQGRRKSILVNSNYTQNLAHNAWSSGSEDTDSEGPPSPSPTPRPGSALSILSSKRTGTPTVSSFRTGGGTLTSGMGTMLLGVPRNVGERSLSFSRSFGDGGDTSLLPPGIELKEVAVMKGFTAPTIEEMEGRLERLLDGVRRLEARLGRIKRLVQ